jgi:general secretion pathway protein A
MYTEHFGLSEPPFSITPDPRYLYMSEGHREALAHLFYGIRQGGGFVQLTGEIGTGKTTVCRRLLERLPPGVDVALILNPRLTSPELLSAACDELRVAYPAGTTSVKVLVDALYRYLLGAHERGRRTVLIVDEAQNLTADVLEQLRLLTNLETAAEKLLQIVLIGQPELATLLSRPELQQVAQRVTVRCHLRPFSYHDTRAYVRHRLRVAGRRKPLFTERALRQVQRSARGVPRLINVICDRALLGAYTEERDQVTAGVVRRAAREVRGPALRGPALLWRCAAALALGAAVWAAVLVTPKALAPLPPSPSVNAPPPRVADPAPPRALAEPTPAALTPGSTGSSPAGPRLASLLTDATLEGDKGAAFGRLYAQWGLTYHHGLACDQAESAGLRCLFRVGTWERLRRLNLPAVLELTASNGEKRYATVVVLGNRMATLEFGSRRVVLPVDEIDPYWDGTFVLLWRAPPLTAIPIEPGQSGRDVEWLRGRLAAIDGVKTAPVGRVFDQALQDRVQAFQRSQLLTADGVVGDETLVRLMTVGGEPGLPTLVTP